jgi:hypothetical protein
MIFASPEPLVPLASGLYCRAGQTCPAFFARNPLTRAAMDEKTIALKETPSGSPIRAYAPLSKPTWPAAAVDNAKYQLALRRSGWSNPQGYFAMPITGTIGRGAHSHQSALAGTTHPMTLTDHNGDLSLDGADRPKSDARFVEARLSFIASSGESVGDLVVLA